MGGVLAIMRVMPESAEVDISALKAEIKRKMPQVREIAEEPIAFGLKALKVAAVVKDDEGGTEPVEAAIASIRGVASVETIDLDRLL